MLRLTSDQNLFWMNSLGISNAAINARLRSMSASLEPASFVSSAFPAEAMSSKIEDTVAIFVTDQLVKRIQRNTKTLLQRKIKARLLRARKRRPAVIFQIHSSNFNICHLPTNTQTTDAVLLMKVGPSCCYYTKQASMSCGDEPLSVNNVVDKSV